MAFVCRLRMAKSASSVVERDNELSFCVVVDIGGGDVTTGGVSLLLGM